MFNFYITVTTLLAIAAVATTQVAVFIRDLRFYRDKGWNFTLDSGNNLIFLEQLKMGNKKMPVGMLRLQVGIFFLMLDATVFWALSHAFM